MSDPGRMLWHMDHVKVDNPYQVPSYRFIKKIKEASQL